MKTNFFIKALIMTFFAVMYFILDADAQNQTVRDHAKLQRSLSFDAVMGRNQGFTAASAKVGLKQAKSKAKDDRKRDRVNRKRDEIYARIENIKSK